MQFRIIVSLIAIYAFSVSAAKAPLTPELLREQASHVVAFRDSLNAPFKSYNLLIQHFLFRQINGGHDTAKTHRHIKLMP